MKDQNNTGREHETPLLIFMFGGLFIMGAIQWMGPNLTPWLVSLGLIVTGILLILVSLSGESYDEFLATTPRSYFERSANSIEIGIDKDSGVPIRLPDKVRTQHVQILGSSGFGKTSSFILPAIEQDLSHGHPIIFVDGKADLQTRTSIEALAKQYSKKLFVFDLRGGKSSTYNPIAHLSPDEATAFLMNSFKWTHFYYEALCQESLKKLCQKARADGKMTIQEILTTMNDPALFRSIFGSIGGGTEREGESDAALNKKLDNMSALRTQLDSLNLEVLRPYINVTKPKIDLQTAVAKGHMVYFRLPALIDPKSAVVLGRFILNDIKRVASTLQAAGKTKFCPVYIDEFAPFAIEDFSTIFAMGRSAGIAMHVSHQSMGDLAKVSDSFANQIIDNTATKIFFKLGDDETAEKAAKLTGTREAEKLTRRTTISGEKHELEAAGSVRDAHAFIFHPQVFKSLLTGHFIMTSAHGLPTKCGGVLTRRLIGKPLVLKPKTNEKKEEQSHE